MRKGYWPARGEKPWVLKYRQDGKTKTKFFSSEEERDKYAAGVAEVVEDRGIQILDISGQDLAAVKLIREQYGEHFDLFAAAQAYHAQQTPITPLGLKEAVAAYLEDRELHGLSDTYTYNSGIRLNRLASAFDEARTNSVDGPSIGKWLASLPYSQITKKTYWKDMNTFYRWLIERGHADRNPMERVPIPKTVETEPEFLEVEQTRQLFEKAASIEPLIVPYLALGFFAGMRTSAIVRLEEKDIDFRERGILMPGAKTKTGRRFYVDGYPDNLWRWLEGCPPEAYRLTERSFQNRRRTVQEALGMRCPHNAARHSFATYHVALHGSAAETATLLTHRGNISVLYNHYRGNATKKAAGEYFGIVPG